LIETGRQHCRELKVGRCAVIEINPTLAPGSAARGRSEVERVDLKMVVVRRFGIVGHVRRPGDGGLGPYRKDESGEGINPANAHECARPPTSEHPGAAHVITSV
jgi:hypothetical protein